MSNEILNNKEIVKGIFNKSHQSAIEAFEVTADTFKAHQKSIVDMYRDEEKFNALKVFEVANENNDASFYQDRILSLDLEQDFLINSEDDKYSVFCHTDGDARFCKFTFSGFTRFEAKSVDDDNNIIYVPYKRFNIFKATIFKNPESDKTFVFLKFNNRRRNRNQMNFFTLETEYFKNWAQENLGIRVKAMPVKDFYYNHEFDKNSFEDLGYNLSDIIDGREENLPVDLKFRPNDRNLKPEDIHFEINKRVVPDMKGSILETIEKTLALSEELKKDLEENLKRLNISKLFFESAYKAFENGAGHIKYIKRVDSYEKPIVYRFDFPADEVGIIKVEIQDSGKYMRFIYDEINRYLSTR